MTTTLASPASTQIQPVIELVTNAVTSRHTKVAYGRALREFIAWYQEAGAPGLSKATVQAHVTDLRAKGKTASSINQRLTAIRKFAQEAAGIVAGPIAGGAQPIFLAVRRGGMCNRVR